MRLDSYGRIVPLVMFGPENIGVWLKSYRIWRNATLMLEHIPQETLTHYPERVQDFADKYPAYLWPLLYQADVRARSEHLLKLARRCREAKLKADTDGVSHPYNPAKPWSYPFELLATGEKEFGDREFREPARDIMNKLATLDEAVEGDAMVSGHGTSTSSVTASSQVALTAPPTPTVTRTRSTPSREIWLPGWQKTNRKGSELCNGFQHGECCDVSRGFCARNSSKVHQCAICLDNRHGAAKCTSKGRDIGKPPTKAAPKKRRGKVIKKGKP